MANLMKKRFGMEFPLSIGVVFCLILLATNFLVQWQISFWDITITVGLLVYPLTFLITDYVSEIYGKKACKQLVLIGLLFTFIPSVILSTFQITIGSLLAYIIAQYHDVWAFHWWKEKTNGKLLWLRNNASTFVSQFLDTIIFTTVAFYGVLDNKTILTIMYSEYPIKLIYALLDTAPLYFLVALYKRSSNVLEAVND